MRAYVVVALAFGTLGIARFFVGLIPLWLQVMCFVLMPMAILSFFLDRRIYLAWKKDIEELERRIEGE